MKMFARLLPALLALLSGCRSIERSESATERLYNRVGEAFCFVLREDVEDGESGWGEASGFLVNDGGTNYLYLTRHTLQYKEKGLPTNLYATSLDGECDKVDLEAAEVPQGDNDVARLRMPNGLKGGLRLANRPPAYGEPLYFFGDAFGGGVMNMEMGKVVAVGHCVFEHSADIVKGMSGGPVVNEDGEVVGLCQGGMKMTATDELEAKLSEGSKYVGLVRKFGVVLHNVSWKPCVGKDD